ncbi:MAG: type II secretion system protein [Acetivibrio sp.]
MKKQRNMGNKGFSLVELIIVIAIMAILVGVIGSQAIPYLEKARESKDLSAIDTVYTAFQSAIVSEGVTSNITGKKLSEIKADTADTTGATKKAGEAIEKLLGTKVAAKVESGKLFTSKTAKDQSVVFNYVESTGEITVSAGTSTVIKVTN